MLSLLPQPILYLALHNLQKLETIDADGLRALWTVFSKSKHAIEANMGRRLENISWRLWWREMIHANGESASSLHQLLNSLGNYNNPNNSTLDSSLSTRMQEDICILDAPMAPPASSEMHEVAETQCMEHSGETVHDPARKIFFIQSDDEFEDDDDELEYGNSGYERNSPYAELHPLNHFTSDDPLDTPPVIPPSLRTSYLPDSFMSNSEDDYESDTESETIPELPAFHLELCHDTIANTDLSGLKFCSAPEQNELSKQTSIVTLKENEWIFKKTVNSPGQGPLAGGRSLLSSLVEEYRKRQLFLSQAKQNSRAEIRRDTRKRFPQKGPNALDLSTRLAPTTITSSEMAIPHLSSRCPQSPGELPDSLRRLVGQREGRNLFSWAGTLERWEGRFWEWKENSSGPWFRW
ncbi:uncharacterized protein VTP21DRAFT_7358 [Calcarisporiella thermophila]|uniref:uncharacterized protein n=1 Tax=Calcarisporiella thermophila TaxID=911321 RepID=UPI003742E7D8